MTTISCFILAGALFFPRFLCAADQTKTPRPLTVLAANPRYFTADGNKPVMMVGADTWYTSTDMGDSWNPPSFDYAGYTAWLRAHNMNFTRFWRVEYTKAGNHHVPLQPYLRSGTPGANDGLNKFQLDTAAHGWNEAYFRNMANRVAIAASHGVYVDVMLFDRFGIWDAGSWGTHPYNGANNVNGIDGNDTDGVAPHYHFGYKTCADTSGPIWDLQTAYVRKVIDTLHTHDNVLYEIQNEGDSTSITWQKAMIDYVHTYEQTTYGYKHPVGMTVGWGNDASGYTPTWSPSTLTTSNADWIAPSGFDMDSNRAVQEYRNNPPAADGKKVVIVEGDHISATDFFKHTDAKKPEKQNTDYDFIWKNFTRGNGVIPLDDLGNSGIKRRARGRPVGEHRILDGAERSRHVRRQD